MDRGRHATILPARSPLGEGQAVRPKYPEKWLPDNRTNPIRGDARETALYRGSGRLFRPRPGRLEGRRCGGATFYELRRRRHDRPAFLFSECQQFGIEYFGIVRKIPVVGADIRARVSNILSKIASDLDPDPQPPPNPLAQGPRTLRRILELRRVATNLASLHNLDWVAPVTAAVNVRERPGIPVSRLNANAIEVLQHIAALGVNDAKLQNHSTSFIRSLIIS
jgi:hypothetical protein